MRKFSVFFIALALAAGLQAQNNASELEAYSKYDFISGEKTIFDDNLLNDKPGATPDLWILKGGSAIVESENDETYISIKEYYTVMVPELEAKIPLPDTFTIEYDTWLDAGYDGNPGVQIHLQNESSDNELQITPNEFQINCSYPGGEENGETPDAIRGEKFYNKWNHISIAYAKPSIVVYIGQFKMFDIKDCKIDPDRIVLTGNASQDMKILFKNFRIAKDVPDNTFEKAMAEGVFITHAIRFDVNKSVIKPESMTVLNEIYKYMKANPSFRMEINGYTDSDGDEISNQTLSASRAAAVKEQLVKMGIPATQLTTNGFGESKPLDTNSTAEGKANNRRVEFRKL